MSDQKPLGREAILASKSNRKSTTIDVPKLGTVRIMEPDTRGSLFIFKRKDAENAFGATIAASIVDESGNLVFDLTDESADQIMSLPGEVVLAMLTACRTLGEATVEAELKKLASQSDYRFAYRLSAHLGLSVDEVLQMPESKFRGWQYLEQREPFGDRRLDLFAGMICSTMVNLQRRENQKPLTPNDFMIDWDRTLVEPPPPTDVFAQFEAFADSHNKALLESQLN